MATTAMSPEPVAGMKRGPGRAPTSDTPVAKKARTSTPTQLEWPAALSPMVNIPLGRRVVKVPSKICDDKPLPTLSEPQPAQLSNTEYQSIAASAVLQTSLSRSQARWTSDGILERYWVKPETGKNARPPPPNNPDPTWMKQKGECRIRIEPHIFECQMYLEEKPRPPPPPKQYAPPVNHSAYGQPYRPHQQPYAPQQHSQYGQSRTLPPITQPQPQQSRLLPPVNNMHQQTPSAPTPQAPRPQQTPPQSAQPAQKATPDPVISKLAARASSDPELKGLMKEVATGNANQEQLRIFQRHIDELQKQIKDDKERKEAAERGAREAEEARVQAQALACEETIQYDGPGDGTPTPVQYAPQGQYTPTQHTPQSAYAPQRQQPYAPSPPESPAVILSFSTPGASEDRFLFPRNSILERLSGYHYLASFIVTRFGRDAADPTNLDPNKEYWQPVTLMLEVKYGLEELPEYVKKWVKPADEVRKWMEGVMARCVRAPEGHLAMRLPVNAGGMTETDDSGISKASTPMVAEDKSAVRPRSNVKYVKKPLSALKRQSTGEQGTPTAAAGKKKEGAEAKAAPKMPALVSAPVAAEKVQKETAAAAATDGAVDEAGTTESGRPKRTVRKSVRISEA
ncbi:hypothetical protein LTR36_001379 [Oleoguttula mirabilis]|uniref:SWR1-complex protein 3 domain-containing protein n=1 Tax=Oleoguttula mirabilis TaxID=1507867 RepID=A0AAV9JNN1_9PEZI|nr:hypothetical protein LTR36_001379 [Oleoguttula mirabilis]